MAEQWLGASWKHKRTMAAVLVLGAGAKLLTDAGTLLSSPTRMWREVARRDPANERAVLAAAKPLFSAGRLDDAKDLADRCIARNPSSCACLGVRLRATTDVQEARRIRHVAAEWCPELAE
jgi:hypothetical protein